MISYCPKCRIQYQNTLTHCPKCSTTLITSLVAPKKIILKNPSKEMHSWDLNPEMY
jgi:hypothetical protein